MTIARFTGKSVPGFCEQAFEILTDDGRRYVASSVDNIFASETLIFALPPKGNTPTTWTDLAGGRGMDQNEALADFNRRLKEGSV